MLKEYQTQHLLKVGTVSVTAFHFNFTTPAPDNKKCKIPSNVLKKLWKLALVNSILFFILLINFVGSMYLKNQ